MSIVLLILAAGLIALSILSSLFYGFALVRMGRVSRTLPTARDGLPLASALAPGEWPPVCIVVPAHNEQAVISDLAHSLLAQDYPNLRIVFALDRCTDDTEPIVRGIVSDDPRVEIVTIDACPEDWAGKTHAVWTGVQTSRGAADAQLLLFTDADTVFDPALVRATVALLRHRSLDLLSLLSRLTYDAPYERLVQPAAAFELIRQYPLDLVNRPGRPRAFANGQFMLFRRELYDRIGGHEAVKAHLLEDIALARLLDKRKRRLPSRWGVFLPGDGQKDPAAGMLRCRMYRNWPAFERGWRRIYTEAALRRPAQLTEWAWRLRFTGVALPCACVLSLPASPLLWWGGHRAAAVMLAACAMVGMVVTGAALARIYRSQRAPLRAAILYPLGAWRVAGILSAAARDLRSGTRTVWAGREYVREVVQ